MVRRRKRTRIVRRGSQLASNGRDTGKLVLRGIPEVWRNAFKALAVLKGMDNGQLMVWLLESHPDVRAQEVTPHDASRHRARTAHPRPQRAAAR